MFEEMTGDHISYSFVSVYIKAVEGSGSHIQQAYEDINLLCTESFLEYSLFSSSEAKKNIFCV